MLSMYLKDQYLNSSQNMLNSCNTTLKNCQIICRKDQQRMIKNWHQERKGKAKAKILIVILLIAMIKVPNKRNRTLKR